jgi:hypothetical protein
MNLSLSTLTMEMQIVLAALFTPSPEGRWGLPLLLWGKSGKGKTRALMSLLSRYGLAMLRLSPGERGEGYFGCTPKATQYEGKDFFMFPAPLDVVLTFADGTGVLFIDEISCAPPALQPVLLGLVQLGTIGNYTLPPRVRVIGASNEAKEAAGGWDLAGPVNNRFGHVEFHGLPARRYSVGLINRFRPSVDEVAQITTVDAEEARVMSLWATADAKARGLVAAFVDRRGDAVLHNQPPKGGPKAWPSQRTVEYAATALASSDVHKLPEIARDVFMASFVGEGWVSEFNAWLGALDLPDPLEVLDGKVQWQHDERRIDRTTAVLSECAALLADPKCPQRKVRAARLWSLIDTVPEVATDSVIPVAMSLVGCGLGGLSLAASIKPLARMQPALQVAGVVAA